MSDALTLGLGTAQGFAVLATFVVAIFIGFCVLIGFTKTQRTAGGGAVIKSLDEAVTHRAFDYLPPTAPRGPADQLRSPDLLEKAAH